jgi:hypothetical protein
LSDRNLYRRHGNEYADAFRPGSIAGHAGSPREIGDAWSKDHVRFSQEQTYQL